MQSAPPTLIACDEHALNSTSDSEMGHLTEKLSLRTEEAFCAVQFCVLGFMFRTVTYGMDSDY
jgi:hypothetical protein